MAPFYDRHADAEWVSSSLLKIELMRAVTRVMPVLLPDARDLPRAADEAGLATVSPRER